MTYLGRLPSLGPRSGRRASLYLLKNRERFLKPLLKALEDAYHSIFPCHICGLLDEQDPCYICRDEKRNHNVLCIISEVVDLWALEKTRQFNGVYHILGGNLSMIDGVSPRDLRIGPLIERFKTKSPQEIILALSPTVEGQTTAHYVLEELKKLNQPFRVSSLARGIPLGGELDYLDEGTLALALKERQAF